MPSIPLPPPRCWAEIDCAALRQNANVLRALAGEKCDVMAIVKADGYGHGLEKVGRVLAEVGISWFGVANVEEALRLGDTIGEFDGVLVLSAAACDAERTAIVAHGFSGTVSSFEEVEAYARVAKELSQSARLHAVVDTGMGRMGIGEREIGALIDAIGQHSELQLEGIATHFPSADEDAEFTNRQIDSFNQIVASLEIPDGCHFHLANSAGVIGFQKKMPQAALIRPGLAIYGISPLPEIPTGLKRALTLKARVTLVRELNSGASVSYGRTFIADKKMRVATLAAGYGDGYPRSLSGSGIEVLIGGKRCPLIGRVTMDQIVVDVSALDSDEVQSGDEAVLIGNQGAESISTAEFAEKAGTIPWEILTSLTRRVKRVYC